MKILLKTLVPDGRYYLISILTIKAEDVGFLSRVGLLTETLAADDPHTFAGVLHYPNKVNSNLLITYSDEFRDHLSSIDQGFSSREFDRSKYYVLSEDYRVPIDYMPVSETSMKFIYNTVIGIPEVVFEGKINKTWSYFKTEPLSIRLLENLISGVNWENIVS